MIEIIVTVLLTFLAQLFFFARWLYKKTRDGEIQRTFVRDMATNHLPHIYLSLQQIARHHGISLDEPPPVQWIELNGVGGKHS